MAKAGAAQRALALRHLAELLRQNTEALRSSNALDPAKAQEDVRAALGNAEEQAQVTVRNLFLGVTGRHIEGFNNMGMHPVASDDRLVTAQDVADAANNAKAITLPAEHTILHTIRQRICLDGIEIADNPVGMLGRKVEAHVHVIHGNSLRIQNSMRLVQALSIEVNQPVFNGLANAFHIAAINGGRHVAPLFAGGTVFAWSEILATAEIPGRADVGALRVLTRATRDLPCAEFPTMEATPDGAGVILELDYWVLMPR